MSDNPTTPKLWENLLDFEVNSVPVCQDPPAYAFKVVLKNPHGEWREVLPSPEALRHFLRGLLAWDALRPRVPSGVLRTERADPFDHPEVQHRLRLDGLRQRCEDVIADPGNPRFLEENAEWFALARRDTVPVFLPMRTTWGIVLVITQRPSRVTVLNQGLAPLVHVGADPEPVRPLARACKREGKVRVVITSAPPDKFPDVTQGDLPLGGNTAYEYAVEAYVLDAERRTLRTIKKENAAPGEPSRYLVEESGSLTPQGGPP